MDKLKSIVKFLAKGELIMWAWSITMITLSVWCTINEKPMDNTVAGVYGLALSAYIGKKGFDEWREMKAPKIKPEEVKQGD